MTVNELFEAWLYNRAPNIVIKVWSIKEVDYIFSSDDSERYDITAEEVEKLEVRCFNTYYDEKTDKNYLIINVD